jgi:hypothetical protein
MLVVELLRQFKRGERYPNQRDGNASSFEYVFGLGISREANAPVESLSVHSVL